MVGLTLNALAEGTQRYGELAARIGGISHKMLTQTLRVLEAHSLVERKVTPTIPVTVEYSLTQLGSTLVPVVAAVKAWAEANVEQVRAAAASYEMPLGGGAASACRPSRRKSSSDREHLAHPLPPGGIKSG